MINSAIYISEAAMMLVEINSASFFITRKESSRHGAQKG
jgi:hypothetical protein